MARDPVVHVIDDDDAARDALTFLLSSANFLVHAYEFGHCFPKRHSHLGSRLRHHRCANA